MDAKVVQEAPFEILHVREATLEVLRALEALLVTVEDPAVVATQDVEGRSFVMCGEVMRAPEPLTADQGNENWDRVLRTRQEARQLLKRGRQTLADAVRAAGTCIDPHVEKLADLSIRAGFPSGYSVGRWHGGSPPEAVLMAGRGILNASEGTYGVGLLEPPTLDWAADLRRVLRRHKRHRVAVRSSCSPEAERDGPGPDSSPPTLQSTSPILEPASNPGERRPEAPCSSSASPVPGPASDSKERASEAPTASTPRQPATQRRRRSDEELRAGESRALGRLIQDPRATYKELAAEVGVTKRHLRRLLNRGRLPKLRETLDKASRTGARRAVWGAAKGRLSHSPLLQGSAPTDEID